VDIERALTNYVRKAKDSGIAVTDGDIEEKARLFSSTMGKLDDSLSKGCSTSWLEKFKQKNGIGQAGPLMRRASEINLSDHHISSTTPSSAVDSPANEILQPTYTIDQTILSPPFRHSSSNNSLSGGPNPGSPTQEDARRAADTLLSFIQNTGGFADQSEYIAVVKLTEKLRLHQNQQTAGGMGGLERIAEEDSEMTDGDAKGVNIEAA
jgi:hypothetical protein